jgi:acyl-CoA reductase-like NAD-dependent aldehyde dehydrogenase
VIEVVEPATAEVMAELPRAGVEETDAAVTRAKEAFPAWRAVEPGERAALLRRLADETGVLSVNSNTSVRVSTPFGGFKQSGLGRELGPHALEHYTELKNVYYATE